MNSHSMIVVLGGLLLKFPTLINVNYQVNFGGL